MSFFLAIGFSFHTNLKQNQNPFQNTLEYLTKIKLTIIRIALYLCIWMGWLFLARLLFVVSNYHFTADYSSRQISAAFWYGAYIDLSLTGYFTFFLILLLMTSMLSSRNGVRIIAGWNMILLCIACIAHAVNNVLYKDWGFPLDDTIFRYISHPGEVRNFIHFHTALKFLANMLILFITGWLMFRKLFRHFIMPGPGQLPVLVIVLALMIIPIRGGLGLSTMRPGTVYFSEKMYLNHVAVNPLWNLMYTTIENDKITDSYHFFEDSEALATFDRLSGKADETSEFIFKNKNPDILFIILESFSGGLIDFRYKGSFVTPGLNKLVRKSLFYPNTFASGDRTDKGIVSIFSAYPAQPKNSVMTMHEKCEKLPSLLDSSPDYNSYFYYGGDADFAGMESYLYCTGFQHILDKDAFSAEDFNAKWGVHDHVLFEKFLMDLPHLKRPFITALLTLSSHPPYDIPVPPYWKETGEEALFYNSVRYTDESLVRLIDSLEKTHYWDNLLICIVADHGARYPGNLQNHSPEKFRIPLLFTGGVIQKHTIQYKKIAQHDIAYTLAKNMNRETSGFRFSHDIFAPKSHPGIYYAFNNGVGWITESCTEVYSLDLHKDIIREGNCENQSNNMKAFLQVLMEDFKNR